MSEESRLGPYQLAARMKNELDFTVSHDTIRKWMIEGVKMEDGTQLHLASRKIGTRRKSTWNEFKEFLSAMNERPVADGRTRNRVSTHGLGDGTRGRAAKRKKRVVAQNGKKPAASKKRPSKKSTRRTAKAK